MNLKEKLERLLFLHNKSSQKDWKPDVKGYENLEGIDNENWDVAYYAAGPTTKGKYLEGALSPQQKQAKRDSRFITASHKFIPDICKQALELMPAIEAAKEFIKAHDSHVGDNAIWAADYRKKLNNLRQLLSNVK